MGNRKSKDWEEKRCAFLREIAADSHFHRAFDALGNIYFFAKNLVGETLFFSRGLLAHHGLQQDSHMLGKTDAELTPGVWAKHYVEDDQWVMKTGLPKLGILELWFDEVGLPGFYLTNKYPLKNDQGAVIGIMGTIQEAKVDLETLHPSASSIMPAIQLLREELVRFPAMEQLADKCFLSIRQVERLFRQSLGMSPRTYWMKCRIRRSCELLVDGRETISSIATRLGFCDQSNFNRQFRQHIGLSPKEYQRTKSRFHPQECR
jgi:AraC-like DNA-binding protein